jgi:hypothetical protein
MPAAALALFVMLLIYGVVTFSLQLLATAKVRT